MKKANVEVGTSQNCRVFIVVYHENDLIVVSPCAHLYLYKLRTAVPNKIKKTCARNKNQLSCAK